MDQMGLFWIEMVEDLEQVIDLISVVSAFGMQGSLVQIQSSRPVKDYENQGNACQA